MQTVSRQSLLAQIHIARKDLGLDDDTYRDMLERITGKRSAADIKKQGQLIAVIMEFRSKGWVKQDSPKHGRKPKEVKKGGAGITAKIEALLAEAGRPWEYAKGMAKHMYQVDALEWLSPEQLRGLMIALIKDGQRQKLRKAEA